MEEIIRKIYDYCEEQFEITEKKRNIEAEKNEKKTWPDAKVIYSLNGMYLAYEDVLEVIELLAIEYGFALKEDEE